VTPPDRHLPFALVDDLDAPALDDAEQHHLQRVRRLRPGDLLGVGDGAGNHRLVRFGPVLEPAGPVVVAERPAPAVTVAFALVKGDRPELVVQKLTEIGVDRIVPFVAARSVVRWDDTKAVRQVERLRAIARGAAAQSHRPWLPTVDELAPFAVVSALPGAALAEPGGPAPGLDRPAVLVGRVGGWAPEELAAVAGRVGLGDHVLRSETAALVAGTLLCAVRRGGPAPLRGDSAP
jgi:16S rRNA (uracil1498-N3)-methyltransferase